MTSVPPLTDTDKIPFGIHEGKAMADVPAKYLMWLYEKGCTHKGVAGYIADNLKCLQKEVSKIPTR